MSIPDFNSEFPARRIHSSGDWSNLVINNETAEQLNEISNWLRNNHLQGLTMGMINKNFSGFKVLFDGPAGTGKSFTAAILGKLFNRVLYSIDINMMLSGEPAVAERKIDKIFELASTKGWMLLFEQPSTTRVSKSTLHDQGEQPYNPAISYLLQAMDQFPGISIFEINAAGKLEENFLNKLDLRVNFNLPGIEERKMLWKLNIPAAYKIDPTADLGIIAENYLLSGAQICKAIEKIIFHVNARRDDVISQKDIITVLEKMTGIKPALKPDVVNAVNQSAGQEKKQVNIFVSYSSRDREMRELLVKGLEAHLDSKPGITYSLWADQEIDMGSEWQEEIDKALDQCTVALLMVSASFAASKYIKENELAVFFKQKNQEKEDEQNKVLVLPVLVRNYNFKGFAELSKLNFFKTYYKDYGFDRPNVRDELMPFDVLGDDEKTTTKKLEDYYRNLSDHIHEAVSNYLK